MEKSDFSDDPNFAKNLKKIKESLLRKHYDEISDEQLEKDIQEYAEYWKKLKYYYDLNNDLDIEVEINTKEGFKIKINININ